MSYIPTVEQARQLVMEFNKEPFHLQHAETVSKVMGELAKEYDPERIDYWAAVGMLHDIDFELYPEQHCVKAKELLHDKDIDESVIHAVISHGYGICIDVEPELFMETIFLLLFPRCANSNGHLRYGGKVREEKIQGQEIRGRLLTRRYTARRGDVRLGA